MKAIFEYPETQEDEEVDLNQLLQDGEVAVSKCSRCTAAVFTSSLYKQLCTIDLQCGHLATFSMT